MPNIDIAHIREQGQNMIIAPLDSAFGHKSQGQQQAALLEIERAAHNAGLAGSAVIVWESGGRLNFLGPQQWHPFLRGINMRWVMSNINKSLNW